VNEQMVLDIGTGTVIGLVARTSEDGIEILARSKARYPKQVVKEGRIVDVQAASEVVRDVVDELNSQSNTRLSTVHFAVPGRGMRTHRRRGTLELETARELRPADRNTLIREREPLDSDRVIINTEVIRCEVDGETVETISGQFGEHVALEWILHSIPVKEIENKRNVVLAADFVPGSVLLEPRAVMRACMSPSRFPSSLAVMDFGAGTIDTAYLEDGKVRNFRTVLGSGDELTSTIQRSLNTDYEEAERMKSNLEGRSVRFQDLGGQEQSIPTERVIKIITPVLREQLLRLTEWFDETSPNMIFLAGGGSQFPFLGRLVSNVFELPVENVFSRSPRQPDRCEDPENLVRSPEDFTVFGMLLLVKEGMSRRYIRLKLNDRMFSRLLEDKKFTARTLCKTLGYESKEPGPKSAIMVSIDGQWRTYRSDARLEPEVLVEGESVQPETELRSGDTVEVRPPEDPEPISKRARDVVPDGELKVRFEGKKLQLKPYLLDSNGTRMDSDEYLEDGREYRIVDTFPFCEILERLENKGFDAPDHPLVRQHEQYVRPGEFSAGESIEVERGVSTTEFGLSRLDSIKKPTEPVSRTLSRVTKT